MLAAAVPVVPAIEEQSDAGEPWSTIATILVFLRSPCARIGGRRFGLRAWRSAFAEGSGNVNGARWEEGWSAAASEWGRFAPYAVVNLSRFGKWVGFSPEEQRSPLALSLSCAATATPLVTGAHAT